MEAKDGGRVKSWVVWWDPHYLTLGEMCNDTVKERYEQHSTVLGKMIIMVNVLCFEVKTKFSASFYINIINVMI